MLKIPGEIKRNGRTYIYQERVNENYCRYKEKRFGWNECFLIQDLIKIKNAKTKGKTRRWNKFKIDKEQSINGN